jgi:UPF0755 protein
VTFPPDTDFDGPAGMGPNDMDPDEPAVEYERVRPPGSTGSRVLRVTGVILLVAAIVLGGTVVWVMRQLDPPGEEGRQLASVTIPSGAGISGIGDTLETRGVIADSTVFQWYARLRGEGGGWRAGDYAGFHLNSSVSDAMKVLDDGPVPPQATSLTITPGVRLVDALTKISKTFPKLTVADLEQTLASGHVTSKYLPPGQTSWEGLLAPDTYQFKKDASAQLILQTLADQQAKVLDRLGYARALPLAGRSAYDLITIASLVEREAGTPPDEKGKVARTIDNRLEKNTPLGVDATVLYGLGRTKGALTKSDLDKDTPYNTRKHAGLPPTPIALPSPDALAAALQPPEGPWLYYVLVSNDPPTHMFTASYQEFLKAKTQAQKDGVF